MIPFTGTIIMFISTLKVYSNKLTTTNTSNVTLSNLNRLTYGTHKNKPVEISLYEFIADVFINII